MYQCPKCGTMSLEPECEWCGPFEDKPKTKDELYKIYGFKSLKPKDNTQLHPTREGRAKREG